MWLSAFHGLIAISNEGTVLTSPMSSSNKRQLHSEQSSGEKDVLPCLWFLLCLDQAGAIIMTSTHRNRVESLQLLLQGLLFWVLGVSPHTFPPSHLLFYVARIWEELNPVMHAERILQLSMFYSLLSVSVFLPVYWTYYFEEFYRNLIFLYNFIKF